MNVLVADLDPGWRGGQNQALLLVRGLRASGVPAELLCRSGSVLGRRAKHLGIPLHVARASVARLSACHILRRLLREHAVDLLHVNEPHALTASWLAGVHRRVPVVISRRVALPLSRTPLALARYRSARTIVAITEFVAQSLVRSGIAREQIAIVHEGVDLPMPPNRPERTLARKRWGFGESDLLLGCMGYLLPEKGQDLLIRAMPCVRREVPGCCLLLAGEGPTRAQLGQLVRQLGLGETVQFAGLVENVADFYAAIDVFVFPSLAEPLGTSLLTAMAYGLPVVAHASGGVPEIVESGRTGLLVPVEESQRDPETLARAIIELLGNPERARALGRAAREEIGTRLSAERMVGNMVELYQQVRAESNAG